MKLENQLSVLTASALGLTLAAGSIGCLLSAFDLPLQNPSVLWGAVFFLSLLYGQSLQWKRGDLIFACLLALALGYLWRQGTAAEQIKPLLEQLSRVYDRAYHWGILELTEATAGNLDLPLGIWAAGISLAAVRSVYLAKRCYLPVLLALIPFAACIVVTDTVPDEKYLFLLLAGLLLLILPASVRRENRLQSIRLTAAATLPAALFLAVLFLAIPQEGYVNRAAIIQENLRTAVNHFPQLMENGLETAAASFRGIPARKVDLSRLGSRIPFTYPVMEITVSRSGILYLRGQDYDRYDGLGWTATEHRQENFPRPEGPAQTVTIRPRGIHQIRHLPYYPAQDTVLSGGRLENPDSTGEYAFSCTSLPEDWRKTAFSPRKEESAQDMTPWL